MSDIMSMSNHEWMENNNYMASAMVLNKPNGDIWLYIDEIDVCENMRRKGVATEMMKQLFLLANEYGVIS